MANTAGPKGYTRKSYQQPRGATLIDKLTDSSTSYSVIPAIKRQIKKYKTEGPSSLLSPYGKRMYSKMRGILKD